METQHELPEGATEGLVDPHCVAGSMYENHIFMHPWCIELGAFYLPSCRGRWRVCAPMCAIAGIYNVFSHVGCVVVHACGYLHLSCTCQCCSHRCAHLVLFTTCLHMLSTSMCVFVICVVFSYFVHIVIRCPCPRPHSFSSSKVL